MSIKNIFSNKKQNLDIKTLRIGGKKKPLAKDRTIQSNFKSDDFSKESSLGKEEIVDINEEIGYQTVDSELLKSDTKNTESVFSDFGNLEITMDPPTADEIVERNKIDNIAMDQFNISDVVREEKIESDRDEQINEFTVGLDVTSEFNPNTSDFDKEEDFKRSNTAMGTTLLTGDDSFVTSFDELTKDISKSSNTLSNWAEENFNSPTLAETIPPKKSIVATSLEKFANLSVKQQYGTFVSILLLGILGLGGSLYVNEKANDRESSTSALSSSIWGESQKLNSSFTSTLLGVKGSYGELINTWDSIAKTNTQLSESIAALDNPELSAEYDKINTTLNEIGKNVAYLKSQESVLKEGSERIQKVAAEINAIKDQTDKLGIIYMQSGGTQSEVSDIYALNAAFDKISSSVSSIISSETISQEDIIELKNNKDIVSSILAEIKDGNESKNIRKLPQSAKHVFNKISEDWLEAIPSIFDIIQGSEDLKKAKLKGLDNKKLSESVYVELRSLINKLPKSDGTNTWVNAYLLPLSILFLLLSLVGLFFIYTKEKEKASREAKADAEKQKAAIYKLINEINPIREGILTQKATMEEGITYDIAKSVNDTVDSLSDLVKRIKDTTLKMSTKSNEVTDLSENMLKKTEDQASSIIAAGSSIIQISKSIEEISKQAKRTLETASESKNAAIKGTEQVKQSVESMNSIANNMNETVVLMKKVSDSSVQISEVIGLLSDITEETNILALNATVQAAKAGEAGKGFKIVANSIQELADNAAEATRRVGALIATVQTDIQSVGLAIERTTNQVSTGVQQSENAGHALVEINKIATELAQTIELVSKDAQINTETAKSISTNMEKILKITEETQNTTEEATKSIHEISNITNELNESVQSFIVE